MPAKKRSPFGELFDHFAELQRMREQFRHPSDAPDARAPETAWVPTTDIFAVGDDIVIRCELAGIEPEDVELSLSRGVLSISGERHARSDQSAEVSYYVHERRFGSFRRTITVPERVGTESLRASLENGLLEILLVGAVAQDAGERIEIRRRGERASLPIDATSGGGDR